METLGRQDQGTRRTSTLENQERVRSIPGDVLKPSQSALDFHDRVAEQIFTLKRVRVKVRKMWVRVPGFTFTKNGTDKQKSTQPIRTTELEREGVRGRTDRATEIQSSILNNAGELLRRV